MRRRIRLEEIHIANIKIESIQNQSAMFSGNNLQYQNYIKKKENKGFGYLTGMNNRLLYQKSIVKNVEKD